MNTEQIDALDLTQCSQDALWRLLDRAGSQLAMESTALVVVIRANPDNPAHGQRMLRMNLEQSMDAATRKTIPLIAQLCVAMTKIQMDQGVACGLGPVGMAELVMGGAKRAWKREFGEDLGFTVA